MKKLTCSLLSIIILLTISCEIGLGASVDTDAPSLNIAPEIVDTVKAKDFDIEGTYSDDGSIQNIRAVLHRTDDMGSDIKIDNYELIEDPAKRGSGTWKIPVNSEEIIDGSYQATVYITDAVGRVTTQNTTFTIDNTPPVLILTKPVSKPGDETISAYGQRIFLEGSIADTSKETNITVDFYNNAECTGEPLVSIPVGPIAPTDVNSNNARIAVFNDNEDVQKLYEQIYQSSTKEGSKDVYIKITASDMAGNATSDFYFSKDLAKNITKTKKPGTEAYGLAPIDIYNILNGTDALKSSGRAAEDSDTANIKRLLNESKNQTAMISVNPENSPYFTVSGMKILTKSGKDFESKENGYYVINGAQSLEISVFMGSDSIELVDDDSDTAPEDREFYVYALECDENGDPLEEDKKENRIKLYSKSKETGSGANKKTYYSIGGKQGHKTTSGAYVFTVPMNKTIIFNPDIYDSKAEHPQGIVTQNLEIGKNYIIRVSGKDNEGNPIEPSEASGYGFHFSSGGGAPVLNITEPKDNTVFYKKGQGVTFAGSTKSDEGVPEVTLWNGDEKIADVSLDTEIDGELNEFSYTIPESTFDQNNSKTYSISIKASRGSDSITESKFSIWYDDEGPVINVNSIQPVITDANTKYLNGEVKFNGTIIDKFDQVGSAKLTAIQNGQPVAIKVTNILSNGTEEEAIGKEIALGDSFEFKLDTKTLTDNKPVILKIQAQDRIGSKDDAVNITEWTETYTVDQSKDKPVFTNSSSSLVITEEGAHESILDDGKNMFMRGSSLVLGVSDDDGLKEAEVILQRQKEDGSFEDINKDDPTKTFYNKIENPSVITHSIPNTVGIYLTTVKAYDNNYISDVETPNNFEKVTFIIRVTGTGPSVKITTPEKEYISTISDDGSINLKFEVKGVGDTFQFYKNEEPLFPDAQGKATPKASPIIYNLQYTSAELQKIKNGEAEPEDITFKVTDTQGFTETIYTPKFDSDWPEVQITKYPPLEPDGSTEEASYIFRGRMEDDTSSIEDVSVKFINGNEVSDINTAKESTEGWLECTSGSTTWTYEATWAGTELASIFATEGKKTVIVKAIDGAGNKTTATQTFTYDKMKPEVQSVSGNTTTKGEDVILTIDLKDTNLVKPQVIIKQAFSGSPIQVSPVVTEPIVVDAENLLYRSTATIPFSTELITNGTYDVEVIAKDANGRTSAAPYKTVRIIRDNVAPEITFTSPSGASSAFIQKSSYKFEGTITDANEITEAAATLYRVTGSGANDKEKVGETETLSPNKDEGGKWAWQVYELDPGTYKLEVYAKDIANNEITLSSNTVNMDNTPPVLNFTNLGLTNSSGVDIQTPLTTGTTYYSKVNYSIVCTVTDVNFDYNYTPSLVKVTAVNSNNLEQTLNITSSSASAFTIKPATYTDGVFTYKVTVKDKAGNSSEFGFTVQRDTTGPNVVIKTPSAADTDKVLNGDSYSFRINATDAGVGVSKLYYAFSTTDAVPQDSEWVVVDNFTDGDKNIDINIIEGRTPTLVDGKVTELCEGKWYLYAKAMDKSGNVTELTDATKTNWQRAFPVDRSDPTLTVANLSSGTVNSIYAEVQNTGYTISGTAEDKNELAVNNAVIIYVDNVNIKEIKASEVSSKNWSYAIPAAKLKSDEPVVLKVEAKDIVGNSVSKSYTLYYDTKDPELEISAPMTDESVDKNEKQIKGTVSDSGYGIKKLEYKLYNVTENQLIASGTSEGTNADVVIKGEQWYIAANDGKINLGDKEGTLRLEVTATENVEATAKPNVREYKTTKLVTFYYDEKNPGLTETEIGTKGETTGSAFTLTGKAWDTNELNYISITDGTRTWKSTDTNPIITLTKSKEEPGDNNWSVTFAVTGDNSAANYVSNGTHEFTITAYDTSKKEKQVTRTITVDTGTPTIDTATITTSSTTEGGNTWYSTRNLSIEVEASDNENGTGIKSVEYTTETGANPTWIPLSYINGKYTGTVAFTSDGAGKKLWVRATDLALNKSGNTEITANIDTEKPVLTVSSSLSIEEGKTNVISSEVTNTGYTISGTVSDSNALAVSDAIEIKVGGTTKSTQTATSVASGWTYVIPKESLTENTNVTLEIIAKDVSGKKDSKEYTLYYDTLAPQVEITAPVPNERVDKAQKAIKGTVNDAGYGVDKVEYTLKRGTNIIAGPTEATIRGEQWFISDGTTDYKELSLGTEEGELTLEVKATEKTRTVGGVTRGGRSNTPVTVEFYFDKANPGLTETKIGTTGKTTKTGFTLEGKVWDSNAIDYIEITRGTGENAQTWKSGVDTSVITTFSPAKSATEPAGNNNNWIASFVVGSENSSKKNYIADGTHDFTIIAYDISGKEYQVVRTVTVDTESPTISEAKVTTDKASGIEGLTGDWYKTRTLSVEVTPSDANGSGVSKVEYTTGSGTSAVWTPLSSKDGKYTGSVSFDSDGKDKKIRIKATDVAGNESEESEESEINLNIDTTAPTLTANYYKLGDSGTPNEAKGIVYIQKGTKLTLFGNYQDADSGVKELTVITEEPDTTTITKKYSTTKISGTTIPSNYVSYDTASLKKDKIKSWAVEYIPTKSGIISIKGTNLADFETSEINVMDITLDEEAPAFSNEKFEEISVIENENESESETVTKSVYQKSSNSNYYTNNTDKTYVISGVATDDVGLADVKLYVANTDTNPKTAIDYDKDNLADGASLGKWKFEFTLPYWKTGATATVTLIDKAGRETPSTYNIVFDTEPPSPDHLVDAKGKDLVFRIGNADNYGVSETGSKYSGGSFGNDSTIMIRGNFTDDDASELKAVWYKIYNKGDTPLFVNGKEYSTNPNETFEALKKDVLKNGKSISPLATKRSQTIYYSVGKKLKDNGEPELVNGEPIPDPAQIFAGSTQNTDTPDDEGYFQYYKDIDTIFSESISGFNEGINYLVLVAEDNAGNTAIDKATVTVDTESRVFPCFSLNVDTNPPTIAPPESMAIKYTNPERGECIISASVTDDPKSGTTEVAGVKDVKFTFEDGVTKEVPATYNEQSGKWEADIASKLPDSGTFTISAVATDAAGTGNSSTRTVATVMIDKKRPTVVLTPPKDADEDTTDRDVNGIIDISGTAEDDNQGGGLSPEENKLVLYYTKSSTLGAKKGSNAASGTKISDSDIASETDLSHTADNHFVKISARTNTASWTISNVNVEKPDGTTTLDDDTEYYLMAASTDRAGNTGYSDPVKVKINKNSDRPIVRMSNIQKPTSKTVNSETVYIPNGYLTSSTVNGSIKDDDGTILKLWVWQTKKNGGKAPSAAPTKADNGSITIPTPGTDESGWIEFGSENSGTSIEDGNWQIESSEGDGTTGWYWAVQDAKGTIFSSLETSDQLKRPYTHFKGESGKEDWTHQVIALQYDLKSPEIKKVELVRFATDLYKNATATPKVRYAAEEIVSEYMEKQSPAIKWSSEDKLVFGRDKALMYVKVTVFEETGMSATTPVREENNYLAQFLDVSSGEVSFTHNAATNTYEYILGPYDLSKVASLTEEYKLNFIATDMAAKTGTKDKSIRVDNTAVITLKGVSPKPTDVKTGEFTFSSEIEDSMSTISAMSYHIPPYSSWNGKTDAQKTSYMEGLTGEGDWTEIPDVSTSWRIDFINFATEQLGYTINKTNNTSALNSKYEAYNIEINGEKQGIYNIPVCFKVTDEVGNIGYVREGKYDKGVDAELKDIIIQFNPNSDRPTVTITDPEVTTDGVLKSGSVTIKGTATDNEGIAAVYIQIEKNGDGTFAEAKLIGNIETIPETGDSYKGLLVSGTKNWKYPLNISDLNTNDLLRIRAIAIDSDTEAPLVSAWSTPTLVKVNNTIPFFQNLYVRQYASTDTNATGTPILEREHESDIYITGSNWYLEGEVSTPTSGNKMTELDFKVDNETDEWTGNGTTATHKTIKIEKASVSYDGQTKFKFKVPVTSDTWSVEIRAKDNTDGNGGEQTETFTVNVDTTKPSFPDMYKINSSDEETLGIQLYRDEYGKTAKLLGTGVDSQVLQNSNGSKFILAGKVTESGSGFDKAVFYFKRKAKGNGSVDRVYNVMEAHGSDNTANRTNIADTSDVTNSANPIYINGDDLPVRALTLTKVSNSKFSNDEIKDNLNIRVGGLVKLGNLYRKITDINRTTGETTITPEYSGTDFAAELVYGMVVDHEGEREDSDGTVNASSDDGDGIYETIDGNKNSGFNWTATFNSANLPDGPIEVHVVVFDKAGLTGHGYIQTKASNNAPRITKVMLGTDMNGNGKFDYGTGEFKTFYAVKDEDDNPIVKSGVANWDLDTSNEYAADRDGNPVYWKVRSGIAAIPEFVGGTGPFYWQMSRAETKITNPGKIASNLVASRLLKASGANEKIVRKTTEGLVNATWSYSTYKVSGEDVENSGGSLAIAADDTLMTTGADALEDKVVYYSFTFWDSTEDCTPGDDTGYTILNAKVKQDITDTTAPVAVIKPFEWTGTGYTRRTIITENEVEKSDVTDNADTLEAGENPGTSETTVVTTDDQGKTTITTTKVIITPKNSLYKASKENGHIELEADVKNNTVIKNIEVGNTTLGADAKVSGKITFHGTAYDETRLSSLWFKFDGLEVTNGMTGGDADADNAPDDYVQAAYYDKDNAVWTYGDTPSTIASGWEIVVSDSKFDQTGHYVDWYLSIDTAKIASQVGIDKALSVIFMDAKGQTSNPEASGSSITSDYTEKYNKPVYSMDVVPYISGITTEIHNKSGLKDSNIRSAKGYYSVIFGMESTTTNRTRDTLENDFIAVHGFNLNPAAVKIVKSSVYNASNVTYETGDPVTFTDTPVNTEFNGSNNTQATGYTTFWAKNDIENSGYLEVFVQDENDNYIRTLNNINNNDSHGSASYSGTSVTRYKNAYNREAEYEGTRNVTLTDDRYILMWDMQKTNTKNGYYPNMLMEGDDPVFGLVDLNGWSESTPSAGTGYANNLMPQKKKFSNVTGAFSSGSYLIGGIAFDQMAMARDSAGKYIYASVYNFIVGSMGIVYDEFASQYNNKWGWQKPGNQYQYQATEDSNSGSNNALTIEGMSVGNLLIDRYQNLKLVADGNSTTSNGANIYMTYYDDYDSSIIFREFRIKRKSNTDSMISASNAPFIYYNGYGFRYNDEWTNTDYDGKWVVIGGNSYQLKKNRVPNYNAYYYTITNYTGTTDFYSDIYPSNPKDNDIYSSMYDSDTVTNQSEIGLQTESAVGRRTVTSSGSRFYDFGIVKSNNASKAVLVYYDFAASKLKVKYSDQALNGSPFQALTWTESALNLPNSVGQYVSMTVVGTALHIAAFDQSNSDLVYIYVPDYATNNANGYSAMTVDAAGSVGNWTSIKIDKTADNKYYNKPIIAYYNSSETGGHDAIKLAIPNAQAGSVTAGIDSSNYTSTGWEYMTVPSVDAAQGGNNKFQRVCLDFDSDGDPVVGYLATNIEFGKQLPEAD